MTINLILLSSLVLAVIWTVMTTRLIRSIIGLALVSVILSILMYRLDSPMAAVFELSVCAGLIPVIFITTISFTQRLSKEKLRIRKKERLAKFGLLPIITVLAGLLLFQYWQMPPLEAPAFPAQGSDVRSLLWNHRHLDLLGQVIILLAGVFGVVTLFKEPKQ